MIHYVDTAAIADALALRIGQITAVAVVAPGKLPAMPEPLKIRDASPDWAQSTNPASTVGNTS